MSQLTVTLKTITDKKTSKKRTVVLNKSGITSTSSLTSHGQQHSISLPMGVPSIEAEEAAASSLSESMTYVPIALLPGHLPLCIIDCIHDSKSCMPSRKRSRRRPGNEATELIGGLV